MHSTLSLLQQLDVLYSPVFHYRCKKLELTTALCMKLYNGRALIFIAKTLMGKLQNHISNSQSHFFTTLVFAG